MNDQSDVDYSGADEPTPKQETTRTPKSPLIATGGRALAIIPRTFDDAWRIGSAAVTGKWAPYGWTKEQATLAIMHGAEVGLPPMMSLQKICIINGRPSLWGDAVPAIALATGQLEDWHEGIRGEGEAMEAYCIVKRRGIKTPIETTFSVADARRAGLWDERPIVAKNVWDKEKRQKVWKADAENDSPWYRHPKRMLQMRARRAFRDAFADAFSGLYIAEEMQERDMRDVTPVPGVDFNPLGPIEENVKTIEPEENPIGKHQHAAGVQGEGEPLDIKAYTEAMAKTKLASAKLPAEIRADAAEAQIVANQQQKPAERQISTGTERGDPGEMPPGLRRKAAGETSGSEATQPAPQTKKEPAAVLGDLVAAANAKSPDTFPLEGITAGNLYYQEALAVIANAVVVGALSNYWKGERSARLAAGMSAQEMQNLTDRYWSQHIKLSEGE